MARERVRPQHVRERRDRRAGLLGQRLGRLAAEGEVRPLLGHRDVVGDAVAAHRPRLEVTGREEREVGRHRLDRAPVHGRAAVPLPLRDEDAVGDHVLPARHRDPDVERRLVARVVVGREPPGRHVRLVHGDDFVPVGQPVALAVRDLGPRDAGVLHLDAELRAVGDRRGGPDPELVVAGGAEARALAVDGHRPDRQQEVEVEARQVLGGADVQPGPSGEPARAERVAVADVVVQHVDAAVAVLREVRVADPHRARRRGPLCGRGAAASQQRAGQHQAQRGSQQGRDEPAADGHARNLPATSLIHWRHRRSPVTMGVTPELPGAPREEARP